MLQKLQTTSMLIDCNSVGRWFHVMLMSISRLSFADEPFGNFKENCVGL